MAGHRVGYLRELHHHAHDPAPDDRFRGAAALLNVVQVSAESFGVFADEIASDAERPVRHGLKRKNHLHLAHLQPCFTLLVDASENGLPERLRTIRGHFWDSRRPAQSNPEDEKVQKWPF